MPQPSIKPYTLKELRNLYGISYKTLKVWLQPFKDEIGECIGKTYNPNQVKTIFEKLGQPSE